MAKRQNEKNEAIRTLFKQLGGNLPIRDLAKHAIDAGIWSDEELEGQQLRSAMEACRRALAPDYKRGIPFAQPDTDEEDEETIPVWRQIDLFDYPQLAQLIGRREKQVRDNYAALRRLVDYCQTRFGKAPSIAVSG